MVCYLPTLGHTRTQARAWLVIAIADVGCKEMGYVALYYVCAPYQVVPRIDTQICGVG